MNISTTISPSLARKQLAEMQQALQQYSQPSTSSLMLPSLARNQPQPQSQQLAQQSLQPQPQQPPPQPQQPSLPVTIPDNGQSMVQQQASTVKQPELPYNSPTIAGMNLDDPDVHLDYTTFNDEILKRKTANFVYFKAACRYCRRFAVVWKELALDLRWWRPAIRFYTIDCDDDDDHLELCRQAGVTEFPQVKFYWIYSDSLDQGKRVRLLGKSVHAMRHIVTDLVLHSYSEHSARWRSQRAESTLKATMTGQQSSTAEHSASGTPSPIASGSSSSAASIVNQVLSAVSAQKASSGGGGGGGGGGSLASLASSAATMLAAGQMNPLLAALSSAGLMSGMMMSRRVAPIPSNWPDLEPIRANTVNQLIDQLVSKTTTTTNSIVLIMDTQEYPYLGAETMLDLSPYANQTYLVRCHDEHSLLTHNLTHRDDIQSPALFYFSGPTKRETIRLLSSAPKYSNDEELRRNFVKTFERKYIRYPVKRVWASASLASESGDPDNMGLQGAGDSSGSSGNSNSERHSHEDDHIHRNDLINGLRISLLDQVLRHNELSDEQLNALVRYVYVVVNYFPFNDDTSMLKYLRRFHSWLQNQVSPVDFSEYKKQFAHEIDDYLPKKDWVTCRSLNGWSGASIASKTKSMDPKSMAHTLSNLTRILSASGANKAAFKDMFKGMDLSKMMKDPETMMDALKKATNQLARSKVSAPSFSASLSDDASDIEPATSKATTTKLSSKGKTVTNPVAADVSNMVIDSILAAVNSENMNDDPGAVLNKLTNQLVNLASGQVPFGSQSTATNRVRFAREYPCSLWLIGHAMVANEYIKDSPRKDVKHLVFPAVNAYIQHFFACPTCGNRVSDVAKEFKLDLEDKLKEQSDSVMLMWKVHNRINKRLESEPRPGAPAKIQFPSESLCPKCRAAPRTVPLPNDNSVPLAGLGTPNWHEKQVLNFLVHHYKPQNLVEGGIESLAYQLVAHFVLIVSTLLLAMSIIVPVSVAVILVVLTSFVRATIDSDNGNFLMVQNERWLKLPKIFDFEQFKATFTRVYSGPLEEVKRRAIYMANIVKIFAHNTLFAKFQSTYFLDTTELADLTASELKALYPILDSNRDNQMIDEERPSGVPIVGSSSSEHEWLIGASSNAPMDNNNSNWPNHQWNQVQKREAVPFNHYDTSRQASKAIDWRQTGCLPSIKHQRSCGSCWAFTAMAKLEFELCRQKNSMFELSEQYLIDCSSIADPSCKINGCLGGHLYGLHEYINKIGVEIAYFYVYRGWQQMCPLRGNMGIIRPNVIRRKLMIRELNKSIPLNEIESSLKNGPLLVGMGVSSDFHLYRGGVHSTKDCQGYSHAMLLIGQGTDEYDQEYWLFRNSQGFSHGENGYYRLSKKSSDCLYQVADWDVDFPGVRTRDDVMQALATRYGYNYIYYGVW
ncbi:Cathepsin 7 [Fragariocoptes setiger]|uniref:Sulfhydryl oxidase n=1 Tax=Fragariocoptes setiger TaxID=1670756 RepID=A0ABQ7S724_9ACAR|nr:Cathepsin 7 [Fragariocoptes setiger]